MYRRLIAFNLKCEPTCDSAEINNNNGETMRMSDEEGSQPRGIAGTNLRAGSLVELQPLPGMEFYFDRNKVR